MGTDIYGFIEVASSDGWQSVFDLDDVERNYQIMGLLFGVRTYGVLPIAPNRGAPELPSPDLLRELERFEGDVAFLDVKWLLWSEVPEELPNGRITTYGVELHRKTAKGLVFDGVSTVPTHLSTEEMYSVYRGHEIDRGRYVYRGRAREERIEIPPGSCPTIEKVMCCSPREYRSPPSGPPLSCEPPCRRFYLACSSPPAPAPVTRQTARFL